MSNAIARRTDHEQGPHLLGEGMYVNGILVRGLWAHFSSRPTNVPFANLNIDIAAFPW